VYVGGIVVLIIFSIFLTQKSGKELPAPVRRRAIWSALAVVAGFAGTCTLLGQYRGFRQPGGMAGSDGAGTHAAVDASVGAIGGQLLSVSRHGYVLPFEAMSLLLLAAMVGCIVIAIKTKPNDR
jgi:NADH-quinone oxidoreductase subunit J